MLRQKKEVAVMVFSLDHTVRGLLLCGRNRLELSENVKTAIDRVEQH
jgi:hypothetical protein